MRKQPLDCLKRIEVLVDILLRSGLLYVSFQTLQQQSYPTGRELLIYQTTPVESPTGVSLLLSSLFL